MQILFEFSEILKTTPSNIHCIKYPETLGFVKLVHIEADQVQFWKKVFNSERSYSMRHGTINIYLQQIGKIEWYDELRSTKRRKTRINI